MNVAILGSEELDIDTNALHKFVKNCVYPHPITQIATTSGMGVMESARMMAREYDIPLELAEYDDILPLCDMVVCVRNRTDCPYIARLCARKGKLFKEYVFDR